VEVIKKALNAIWETNNTHRVMRLIIKLPFYMLAIPIVLIIRAISPWYLVRIGGLISHRIGHFSGNTELYCCERDARINTPHQRYLDLFYFMGLICNDQLATMWRRVLPIWPAWFLAPVRRMNKLIPGWALHEIGTNTQEDRDVHNLQDRFSPHLKFTLKEESVGEKILRNMGIPLGAKFVCINVRDSAYLDAHQPVKVQPNSPSAWSYHNYRDSNVQSYINSTHPRVIDYACNGMRSDFMDIYLCAKCWFMISTGDGLVGVPRAFMRPVVTVNLMPMGYFLSYHSNLIGITKHHYLPSLSKFLTLNEIFTYGVGYSLSSGEYNSKEVQIINNTPEEIRDVIIEMVERLNGTWKAHEEDEKLQKRFWEIFPKNALDALSGKPLHGAIRAKFGASFLRNNQSWIK